MNYMTVVGLEVHVQLLTQTKLFCGCANRFNPTQPNVQTCPVCLGLPGSLPVMNRFAFELALKTGLALNCTIPPLTKWDRKQYYYPDLPKGYQISQYDLPFSVEGWLEITTDSQTRRIGIIRAHLEEDAGKNLHDETGRGGDSLIDLNRAGTPLLEIVSKPDLRSGAEAHAYLDELKLLLTYLQVSDCNMQEGSLRCDANVNLHVQTDDGLTVATPIVEVKNLNSFRGVESAIEYEAQRQFEQWKQTGHKLGDVPKETRGWDAERGVTFAQRGKEEASDYRYFPDPDLVPVTVSEDWKRRLHDQFCEFPATKRRRFETAYQLSHYDASVIVAQGQSFAAYFERVAATGGDAKQAANWVTQDVLREMKERKTSIEEFPISPDVLGAILSKIGQRQITTNSGRTVFNEILAGGAAATGSAAVEQIIAAKSLAITADAGELAPVVEVVLAKNAKIVADVQAGKQQAIGALIGQVMRQAKGADPQIVRELLIAKIASLS
ncbi:MAG TPA: Asp-tRNA(Asn)/Glu-tRNA(Gln) amidotransferase subunit GatB [Planctomycetaceae bacterium]|jgi:aspartyl-tRNA(Asn)/glutamyl-tRNA(Gln) amidotransferase subunit B|nr:Asp-tRNA(Asn)/Glu-tRNA(Gln) amidotransferase subunit GatB [Planctomycetaceae bacterium]